MPFINAPGAKQFGKEEARTFIQPIGTFYCHIEIIKPAKEELPVILV